MVEFCLMAVFPLPVANFQATRLYEVLTIQKQALVLLVQLILHVVIQLIEQRPRPVFKCPCCKSPMVILGFRRIAWKTG
jgi:hypothetical protein